MNISAALAIYFIMWFLVLFTVLPFGVRSHAEEGSVVVGTEAGAPVAPAIIKKMLITTVISALLFAGFYYLITQNIIDFENLPNIREIKVKP